MWILSITAAFGGSLLPQLTGRVCTQPDQLADQVEQDLAADGSPVDLAGVVVGLSGACCSTGGVVYLVRAPVPYTSNDPREPLPYVLGQYVYNGDCTLLKRTVHEVPVLADSHVAFSWSSATSMRRVWETPPQTTECTAVKAERAVEALLPPPDSWPSFTLLVVPKGKGWLVHQLGGSRKEPPYDTARSWRVNHDCLVSPAQRNLGLVDPQTAVYAVLR